MGKPNLCDQKDCTGCLACVQRCPFDAIEVKIYNSFSIPVINHEKCRECGLCEQTCPVLNKKKILGNKHSDIDEVYAAYNSVSVRMLSSSGGVFTAMAEEILKDGGIVYGAAWSDKMVLHHIGIDKLTDLDKLRRSKYVQSDIGNTFRQVKTELNSGRRVLYSGTPCQIAGLISYLGKLPENLITVDVVCQGVPSPELFKKYLDEVEQENGMETIDANFRTKDKGWRCGLLLLLLRSRDKSGKERKVKQINEKNAFYNSFIKGYFMRESCYNCKFKKHEQGYFSDITIGDFWRIGNIIPFDVKDYEKGISALIINTDKGRDFFASCKNSLTVVGRPYSEFDTNGGLRVENKPKNNDEAYRYLLTHTWKETQNKFFPVSIRQKISTYLWMILGEKNIRSIKHIFKR